ncbi:hypothetical protein A2768_01490 [Candidatus Roizmanbacteria bacterium RIFCSPHIGHO2_01_FULL_37_16]|nr:MAG: hypothetical protein A2768_01490 [Candidatus Roizmanbacteria bacterium RIFCSPHIGHO2_01_FULL_37_16]
MGRELRINNKLTRKQTIFIQKIVEGQSGIQAAKAAYNTSNSQVAASIAHENLNKPYVREAIEEVLRSKGMSLDTIMANIGILANSKVEKVSGEVKLKANIELLKLLGAYTDQKNRTFSTSIKQEIQSLTFDEAKKKLQLITQQTEEFLKETEG